MELGIALKSLENRENSYKESTDELGVSQIVYYGSNEVMSGDQLRAWLAYQLLSGGKESRFRLVGRSADGLSFPLCDGIAISVLPEAESARYRDVASECQNWYKAGRYGLLPLDWACKADGAV